MSLSVSLLNLFAFNQLLVSVTSITFEGSVYDFPLALEFY